MKYILILLVSFSFAQVIAPIGMGETEYNVTWCVREEISDPCPNTWMKDEFGRDVFYGCLVYHFHYEYDCAHSKNFNSYEEAEKFAKKAVKESNISEVKLNGTLIPKPKIEYDYTDITSDSVSVGTITAAITNWTITGVTNIPITRENLFDYAEECYNDKKKIDEDNWCFSTFPGYVVYNEMWRVVYLHREPTFAGFIEWLKK